METLRSDIEGLQSRRSDLSRTLEDLETAQETLARLSSGEQDQKDKEELDAARNRHGEPSWNHVLRQRRLMLS